ncbi:hypothetical protein NQ318_009098, partial [Aromia moschata]
NLSDNSLKSFSPKVELIALQKFQKYSVKLISYPKCNSPGLFKGHLLRKLKIGDDIHCKSPAAGSGLPIVDLRPNENQDVMDLVYAVKTIENYIAYAPTEHIGAIGSILIDVTNNLLELPRFYLREADQDYGSCKKLVNVTETLATVSTSSILHKSNVAIEMFPVKKDGFPGMKCTWYVNPNNRRDSLFSCVSNNQQDVTGLKGKVTEASITIPENLFRQLQEEQQVVLTGKVYNILVAMYSTNKLFPIDEARTGKEDVTSSVVGVKLVDIVVRNLSDPVFVMLRTPSTSVYEVTPFTPVWWDPCLDNGTGGWSSDGCQFSHELQDHLVFSCDTFSYYGLLQDVAHLQNLQAGSAKFKLSHPAVYVGSFILFASLLIAVMTYLLCYATIQMPKKAKHSLVNTWIAIALLCFMYVFGIYQTEDMKVCQVVGMILHYFTLCSLLWMCVGVNCMYKRLSKNDVIGLQDDDLPSEQPVRKPILGLYLVGWGVGLIVCGLSAAINMNEYASPGHCFLRTGPAPKCAISNLDANGHLSEGTQATEHVDLDLLEPNFPNVDARSMRSISTKTASSEVEDPEHAPSAQLKAYVIFLFIYVTTWLSCAFATLKHNAEQNIFGTNSKVNNTNIHVEHIRKIQQKNPNIFSDSADDFESISHVPVENIMINAERLRKKELSKGKTKKKYNVPSKSLSERTDNNMRSVSQQCTLDYSSETISDSILDKTNFDNLISL